MALAAKRFLASVFGAVALLGAVAGPGAPRFARAAGQPAADAPVPFASGEQLQYRIGWQNFLTAATARLSVVERRPFYGRTAWHFQARARTADPVRLLYTLDDQFDSYTDTVALAGLQYETHIREQGRQEDTVVRMSTEGQPAAGDESTVRVPAGTRDPLGAFYSLRATDWNTTEKLAIPVYDGKKLYELRVQRMSRGEEITVPVGSYRATRLELRVFERGREVQGTRFLIWLSEDARHLPLLIEAELPFGVFRVELESAR